MKSPDTSANNPVAIQRMTQRKWWLLGLIGAICVIAWIVMIVGLLMGVETATRFVLVTAAAVATEALIWTTAAIFGLTIYEARRKIWRWIRDVPARIIGSK